jgi:hypothetical protein
MTYQEWIAEAVDLEAASGSSVSFRSTYRRAEQFPEARGTEPHLQFTSAIGARQLQACELLFRDNIFLARGRGMIEEKYDVEHVPRSQFSGRPREFIGCSVIPNFE